jgi:crotonobetainyl-CoA:carnitine CoA-transferase CaiB-like acyl-CoA transferase
MVNNLNLAFLTGLTRPEQLAANIEKFKPHINDAPGLIGVLGHMYQVFSRFCASMKKWDLYEGAQRQRLMIGIVSTPEDLAKNPQLAARDWYRDVEHDHLGATVRYAGPPYRLSETPAMIRRRPPLPGEHTSEILAELGYSESDIASLAKDGAI